MSLLPNVAAGNQIRAGDLLATIVARSYQIGGATPSVPAGLTLTYGAQEAIVNNSSSAQYVLLAAGTQAFTASKDTYVDLGYSGAFAGGAPNGTLTLVAVTNGAAEPAVTANSLRLWKVVSGASAITSVAPRAAASPLPVRQVIPAVQTTDTAALTQLTWNNYTALPAPQISILQGSSILVVALGYTTNGDTATQGLQLRASMTGGGLIPFGRTTAATGATVPIVGAGVLVNPGAGTYSATPQYQVTGGTGFFVRPSGQQYVEALTLLLAELAGAA